MVDIFMNDRKNSDLVRKIFAPVIAVVLLCTALYMGGTFDDVFRDSASHRVPISSWSISISDTDTEPIEQTTATEQTTSTLVLPSHENAQYVRDPDYLCEHYVVVFLQSQNVIVYGKDSGGGYTVVEKCFSCSTGEPGHTTRTGLYSVRRKYEWRLLVGDVYGQYSTGFSGSYLFHSVPYASDDPSTLDMDEYRKLGQPASHGCVRLCVRDAKWIFENLEMGTQVNIVDAYNETIGEPIPAASEDSRYDGWDPTDPSPDSPYNR